MPLKIYILPSFPNDDKGEGGIRRVVEAQRRWLPKFGFEPVDDIKQADIVALHAGEWEEPPDVGVPVVSHCHGLYWSDYVWPNWANRVNAVVLKNLKLADAITAPSEWVRNAIARNTWLNPEVLCHGIEPDEWPEPIPGDSKDYILWNKTRPDAICDPSPVTELADRCRDRQFVTTFVNEGGGRGNIQVTGSEPYGQAKQRIRTAGVYLATTRETFGIGTLEAMAAGVPVLGYDWGGQPEIVVHKECGYLAEPGDIDDLAVGLDYIIQHRDYLSRNARSRVLEQFRWEQWIEQYAKLYNRVINEHRAPKVSVVITNYNLNEYLPEAINSAKLECSKIDGTYEIILVDDASTQPLSPEIVNDKSLLVIKNPENLHLAGSLNVGVGAATGRYVLCLDADNHLANLPSLVRALDADRGLDIAYGKMSVFGENYEKSWIPEWPPKEASLDAQLAHQNQITSTALYRRKIFSWVGGYRRRCGTAEDADFWTRALAVGAKARRVTDQVTLEYRDRVDSMSHTIKDWDWHHWYGWANSKSRLATVGGSIHTYEKPVISVVIPVGPGHEELVQDALDSVQAQLGFSAWEAVVVNDTGRELKLLPAWARVVPGGRLGVSHARNRGMLLAKGEYVLFLDADDYLHPESLYHLYNTITTSNCQNVFVYSDWFEAETGKVHTSLDFNPKTVFTKLAHPVTALYRKWDLEKSQIKWDESFKDGWEDWDFGIQVAARGGLCGIHIKAPLLHYRLQSGSLRSNALEHAGEIKLKINFKWADYISGEKGDRMPGCGGCGGGRYPSLASRIPNGRASMFENVDVDKETTLIEYTPPPDWTGTRSFLGRVTGNRYRFSPDASGRVRRVYNVDVPGLEQIGFFRKVAASGADPENITPLAAPGPPVPA